MHTVEGTRRVTSCSSTNILERPASFFSTPPEIGSRWRVLIVNAHASIREMIRIVLETHSDLIEVVGEASDGEEAIAQAQLYPLDLVLMDIHLSDMNSIDVTKQMRRALPQLVIVGIAAEYSPLLYNAMSAAGAVAFVRTEDTADLLFRTIVFAMCAYHPAHAQAISVHAAAV